MIGLINFKYYQLNFYSASKFSPFDSPWSPDSPFYHLFREWDDKGVVERCAFLGHHITAMVSFMWILETNQLLYFANHRLMAEWSTPLLNAVLLSDHFPNLPFIVKDILKGMDFFRDNHWYIENWPKISIKSELYINIYCMSSFNNSIFLDNDLKFWLDIWNWSPAEISSNSGPGCFGSIKYILGPKDL